MSIIDTHEMRRAFADALNARRVDGQPDSYTDQPGGREHLYGLISAVHAHYALGLPIGDRAAKRSLAQRILSYQTAEGIFTDESSSGPEHALAAAVSSLNLLGQPIPSNIAPLAPTKAGELDSWLHQLDWSNTHKPLWGATTPLLATGSVDQHWIQTLLDHVEMRLGQADSAQALYVDDDPPWRVISRIYHVMSILDAGCIAYPQPRRLADSLLHLNWTDSQIAANQTTCTDADWAHLLLKLARQCPEIHAEAMKQIRTVSTRRVQQWHAIKNNLATERTFGYYLILWSSAVFQHNMPEHFVGPPLLDTLNCPALYRL